MDATQRSSPRWDRTLRPFGCVLCAAFWGAVSSTNAEESEAHKAFQRNWEKAEQAYTSKDYGQAISYYDKVRQLFPFEPTTRFQLACCHARLGNIEMALAALEAAVSFGWDDARRIEKTDDLKDLRAHTRFANLIKAAAACSDETMILYAGKTVVPKRPAPLVVLLQGLGCGPRAEVPYWKPAADQLGLIIVAPRAVTKVGSMMYGWHRPGAKDSNALDYFDVNAAEKRIDEVISHAKRKFAIDREHIVVAGFSQGGGVALRMLGDGPEKYCGAVAVCSLCQQPGIAYWNAVAEKRPVRVFAIAGKLDRLLPRTQKAVEQLVAAKVTTRYEELERTGHEYPTDYSERLCRAIEFVLNRPSPQP